MMEADLRRNQSVPEKHRYEQRAKQWDQVLPFEAVDGASPFKLHLTKPEKALSVVSKGAKS